MLTVHLVPWGLSLRHVKQSTLYSVMHVRLDSRAYVAKAAWDE